MRVGDWVVRGVRSRVENQYARFVRSTFVDPFLDTTHGPDRHLDLILEKEGLALVDVLKTRPDSRGVYVVKDSEGEISVLKTWYTSKGIDRGLAYQHRANVVSAAESRLFPSVRAAQPDYTIEEFVQGRLLRHTPAVDLSAREVSRFLGDLKSWSVSARRDVAVLKGDFLHRHEVIERCRNMIDRAFRHSRYRPRKHIPGYLYRFRRRRKALRDAMGELAALADRVDIPRSVMCGDVHPGNIVVDYESDKTLVIVDYEEMNDGHFGFDVVNLSSQVYRLSLPASTSNTLRTHIADSRYMGGTDISRFFLQLDLVLKEILAVIFDVPDSGRDEQKGRTGGRR